MSSIHNRVETPSEQHRKEHTQHRRDPKSPWRPLTFEERAVDAQWRKAVGWGWSDLHLSNKEVDVYLNPFRFPEEELIFNVSVANGLIKSPKGPLSNEELQHLPPDEVVRLTVDRLGGANGFRNHIKERVGFFERFRAGVDRLVEEEGRRAVNEGLLTQEELNRLPPDRVLKIIKGKQRSPSDLTK